MMFPPGYLSHNSLKAMRSIQAPGLGRGTMTIDNLIDAGIFLCGRPRPVRNKLVEAHRRLGFQNFLANLHFRDAPRRSHERISASRARGDAGTAGAPPTKNMHGMESQAAE